MKIYVHVFNICVNEFHDPTRIFKHMHEHLLPLYYLISDHYASHLSSYVINLYVAIPYLIIYYT